MQKAFGFYLASFPSFALVYGAFATLPIFLLWLYLSWAVVLLGALVAATLPEFRRGSRQPQ
jgi:membrane protein